MDARPLVYWPGLTPFAALALNEAGPVWATEYGQRVISISPPGIETEARPPDEYRLSRLAQVVVRLLDDVDVARAAFVGYSWGASIGCHVAASYSERLTALVLLDAGYQDMAEDGKDLAARIDDARAATAEYSFPDWEAFLEAAQEGRRRRSPALDERLRAGMREERGRIVLISSAEAAGAAMHGVIGDPPTAQLPAIGRLDLPVLLLASSERGDTDEGRAAIERFRFSVPQVKIRRIADSGHDLLADQPEETIRAVGDFLSQHG